MARAPGKLCAAHHRCEYLVVVLATAKIAGDAVGEFLARGAGIGFQISDGGHDEAGHAEGALESLFVNDALLHGVERSVSVGETLDGEHFAGADDVGEYGAGIVRKVVSKDGAGAAFG